MSIEPVLSLRLDDLLSISLLDFHHLEAPQNFFPPDPGRVGGRVEAPGSVLRYGDFGETRWGAQMMKEYRLLPPDMTYTVVFQSVWH